MASIMSVIFKKWRKALIIPAIIIQLPCSILMIMLIFLIPEYGFSYVAWLFGGQEPVPRK